MKEYYCLEINRGADDIYTANIREDGLRGTIIQTFVLPWEESFYPEVPTLPSDWLDDYRNDLKDFHGIELERLFVKK